MALRKLTLARLTLVGLAALALSAPGFAQDLRLEASHLRTMEWRNIGPLRGGRSLSCIGSPGRRHEYYFGATGGGLWKTLDSGTTWFPVTDGQISSSSIGAVAVAETNPDVVFIGGGETQLRGSITQGDGVYKSSDGGETWRHVGLRDTQAVARIRIHPVNPDIVYVAALGHPYGDNEERGVFRSRDGGSTWERVLFVSPGAGAADLIIDRTNPDVLYASIWQVYRKAWKMWGGGPDSGLYRSDDGGDTWTELTGNPGMPAGPIGKIGVTVSPANPDRVWAIVEAPEGGVFRSEDGGATWRLTNNERKLRQRAFYYSRIYADPVDVDTVYALNTGFYKSTDGGETFDHVIRPPHGDQHDLWIDPNNPLRMCNSNDGGGNVSVNGGETWTGQAYSTTQLYHVNVTNDFPYHVCGAQQDNTTLCTPSEGWDHMQARGPGSRWYYDAGGGESGYITQHPSNLDVFYAGSQGALLTRYNRANGQIRDIQVYPAVLLRGTGERAPRPLAVDLPDHLLAARREPALHEFAVPLHHDGRRPVVDEDQSGPHLRRPRDARGDRRPHHDGHERPRDLRDDLRGRAFAARHRHDLGRLGRRAHPRHPGSRGELDGHHPGRPAEVQPGQHHRRVVAPSPAPSSWRPTATRWTTASPTSSGRPTTAPPGRRSWTESPPGTSRARSGKIRCARDCSSSGPSTGCTPPGTTGTSGYRSSRTSRTPRSATWWSRRRTWCSAPTAAASGSSTTSSRSGSTPPSR